ncbi:tyrosine-type recombinase/integrase [Sphingosinicella sp. LY1275]|uniref:tyrosine-type recombinase/integrase n=1 Tax=Sphingosinicella sp. LY1275 TaxID=3095379 RepID=UPI002ADEDD01|nr:tyrosine-type recombinase/integrase [Sphingosinicella sp. LY1275]MEA1015152.1 tyrosine-type recombinase/integrase [Sphingosinicella sp. LY1275]
MIKGVHFVRRVHSGRTIRWYVYAWRGGPCILKTTGPAKPRLGHQELRAIQAALETARLPDPTTLRSLVHAWRSEDPNRPSSPEWERLSAGTKQTWGFALNRIEEKWGDTPLAVWNDPRMVAKVVAWRDERAATPRAADIGVTVLRALLEFGRLRGRVIFNAAANIPTLYRNGQRAEIIWTDEDLVRFAEAAERMGRTQLTDGLRLAALTGLRREDLVTLTWSQVGEFAIVKRTLKRSAGKRRLMAMPRIPSLDLLLDELRSRPRKPGVETVLVNSFGEPWTGGGFGGSFNRVRDEADIVHVDEDSGDRSKKHLHDVRGTFCTRLLTDTDLADREVAEIMGWSPDRVSGIRRLYVDQSKVVVALGERLRGVKGALGPKPGKGVPR